MVGGLAHSGRVIFAAGAERSPCFHIRRRRRSGINLGIAEPLDALLVG
jgi:hypothetical protein